MHLFHCFGIGMLWHVCFIVVAVDAVAWMFRCSQWDVVACMFHCFGIEMVWHVYFIVVVVDAVAYMFNYFGIDTHRERCSNCNKNILVAVF